LAASDPGSEQATQLAHVSRALRAAVIEHYSRRGELLDDERGIRTLDTNSTLAPERAQLLLDLLARRGTATVEGLDLVDLGCGFGSLSLCLAALGARVVGVDQYLDRMSVAAAVGRRLGLPVEFRRCRLEAMTQLPDQSADVAVMNNSLCYVTDLRERRRVLAHALRVLRPGGWLVIRDPSRASPLDPFSGLPAVHQLPFAVTDRLPRRLIRNRSKVRLRSRLGQRRELRAAGFEAIKIERLDARRLRPQRYQHFTAQRPTREQLLARASR
jgi:SAM-dependent methyltransferase